MVRTGWNSWRGRGTLIAGALAGTLALAACSPGGGGSGGSSGGGNVKRNDAVQVTGPKDGATDVPAAAEITFKTEHGTKPAVQVVDANGERVPGGMRADGSSWVPAHGLNWATKYTVTVTGSGEDEGKATATFTTMAKPATIVGVHSYIGDNQVVGVGMPLVLTFDKPVPDDVKPKVQRRLFVTTEPAQEGIWNWMSDKEVHYRPKEYWQAGTKLRLRAAVGGLDLGNGGYGGDELTVDASVGDKVLIKVDNNTKRLTYFKNDQAVKTMPVSLGKPSAPSSSGNMVVMDRKEWEWFDSSTYGVPVSSKDGYRTKVYWDLRITWGGQYIHAAPWSVKDQGVRNVSHGCVNVSTENAKWLFTNSKIGDPVQVRNTGAPLKWGDGWTDWNLLWEEYVQGSAIPYGPESNAAAPASDR